MITPHLVEALLAGLILNDEACDCYPELGRLRARARGREEVQPGGSFPPGALPWQWALCTCNLPLARGLVRHAARALLDLLDALDAADEAAARDDCYLWHALRLAPPWLTLPLEPDDDEPDIALLLERDEDWGGDWLALIEDLHRAGSETWQWAIRRCRAMRRFEQAYGVNLRDLLAATEAAPEVTCGDRDTPTRYDEDSQMRRITGNVSRSCEPAGDKSAPPCGGAYQTASHDWD
jgi:hypothetical protein